MSRFIYYLIILVIAVVLGIVLNHHPGYVLIAFGHTSIETSFWFALICLIVAFFILYHVFRLLRALLASKGHFRAWYQRKQLAKAHSKTSAGLLALDAADYKSAERLLLQGVDSSPSPLVNYLAAARAAMFQQNAENCERHLKQAAKIAKSSADQKAYLLTEADLSLKLHNLASAENSLTAFSKLDDKHPRYLALCSKLYETNEQWQKGFDLLPRLKRRKVFDEVALNALEHRLAEKLLTTLTDDKARQAVWKKLSKTAQKDTHLQQLHLSASP
jgi:HemY protein